MRLELPSRGPTPEVQGMARIQEARLGEPGRALLTQVCFAGQSGGQIAAARRRREAQEAPAKPKAASR